MKSYCLNRENLMNFMLGIIILINIILLATDSYFSLSTLDQVDFGLEGAIIKGEKVSYSDLKNNCTLPDYCDYIPGFLKSGSILVAMFIIDILFLTLVIIQGFLLTFMLKKIIGNKEALTKRNKCMLRGLALGKVFLFLHPIVINLGAVLWVVYSDLNALAKVIVLHEGLIILIIQCFFSLLIIAYHVWVTSSVKRRNLRIMRSQRYKKSDLTL